MIASHWFYASPRPDSPIGLPNGFEIETFGLGNHPRGIHWYATEQKWKTAIREFEREGYERRFTEQEDKDESHQKIS